MNPSPRLLAGAAPLLCMVAAGWVATRLDSASPTPLSPDRSKEAVRLDPTEPSSRLPLAATSRELHVTQPIVGLRWIYSLAYKATSKLQAPNAPGEAMEVTIDGDLWVTVVEDSPAGLVLEWRLPESTAHVSQGGRAINQTGQTLSQSLTYPVYVQMDTQGAPSSFAIDPRVADVHRDVVRSIMAGTRCELQEGEQWTTTEGDTTGPATYAYQREGELTTKERIQYTSPQEGFDMLSSGSGSFTHRETELIRAEWQESTRVDGVGVELRIEYASEVRLELTSRQELPGDSVEVNLAQMRWMTETLDAEARERIADESELERAAQRLADASVLGLLNDLERALRAGGPLGDAALQLQEDLALYVKLHPEALGELERMLDSFAEDLQLAQVVLAAVGRAQHLPAQEFLVRTNSAGSTAELRMAALDSMFQLQKPGAAVIAQTWQQASEGESERFATKGILAYGALSGRAQSDSKADDIDQLLAYESTAKNKGTLSAWLSALGNTQSTRVVQVLERYIGNTDPMLRSSALDAAARVPGPEARVVCLEGFQGESLLNVKAAVAEPIGIRSDVSTEFSIELTSADQPTELRCAGTRVLRQRSDELAAERLTILRGDSDEDVARTASGS